MTQMDKTRWTETRIAKILAQRFMNRSTLIVPNCGWTGNECDLLVIDSRSLRIIDIEIKISRADLKADMAKTKWWEHRPWSRRDSLLSALPRERKWPDKVWKHYYCMPREIWTSDLVNFIPEHSGVIFVYNGHPGIDFWRHAKPNRDAKPICHADAIDLARLASLRMWAVLTT